MASLDLSSRNGIGDRAPTSNYRVREIRFTVARETGAPPRLVLDQPALVAQVARQLIADDAREHFWIALLDAKLQLVAWHHISTGHLTATLVSAREVFGPALRVMGVSGIACAHNHPSGDPTPSPDDIRLTRQLADAGRLLDVRVHDHVVIGNGTDRFVSLRERGVIS